ncbi:MAG: hypothetical protein NTX72_04260 [Candidatus Uhrbacteria bacterium]|nr:hypothetical protein [Candidatus Uhrbacteria bacterium]
MKKSFLVLFLIVILIGISSQISRADDSVPTHISSTPEITDHGTFHVARYKSDLVIQALGLVHGNLLASFSTTEHAWFFKTGFTPVTGTDPAKALGYPSMQTAESFLHIEKKSPCIKFKDAVSEVAITETKTLCLSSSPGGDFTLHLLPALKDKPIPIGFGKHPILEKTRVSWVGYDGNLYIASLHPSLFADDVTALKEKTSPTVFLLRNEMKYSVPSEQVFYTWFDSFKSVSLIDARKLATYPIQAKAGFRPNTLIQFTDSPDIYVYQPANEPHLAFGKAVVIITEKPDKWVIQDPKNKKLTFDFIKRPELLRHIASQTDLDNTFGPTWNMHVLKLDASLRTKYNTDKTDFNPKTDIIYE